MSKVRKRSARCIRLFQSKAGIVHTRDSSRSTRQSAATESELQFDSVYLLTQSAAVATMGNVSSFRESP
jgi:hypothetical protein